MSAVSVYTYSHSVTYVADNILKSFRDIIRLSGLNPKDLVDTWESKLRALTTWIESKDLEKVILEIYHPVTGNLVVRWDLEIVYNWSTDEGTFYTDTDQLRYAIKKAGVVPSEAKYDVLLHTKPGRPDVDGWGPVSAPTEGCVMCETRSGARGLPAPGQFDYHLPPHCPRSGVFRRVRMDYEQDTNELRAGDGRIQMRYAAISFPTKHRITAIAACCAALSPRPPQHYSRHTKLLSLCG